jgi:predicted Zn-dependent peptidase
MGEGGADLAAGALAPDRTELDGVPIFSLDVPGPLRAMLIFRVGVVDETLPNRGITHVVEHLAVYPLMQNADAANRINATVEPLRTRFMATGTEQEIASFLADVTSNLAALPLDRLQNEKRVLRTEAANRTTGSLKAAWSWRFGAKNLGVTDYEEFGLRWLTPDAVVAWAESWFTAGNAVLWLSGPVPDNLKLNLKAGPRKRVPDVKPLDFSTPAIYQQGDRWALLSMLGARGTALFMGTRILDNRLRDRLRHQDSIAYEVHADYQRVDGNTAEITAFADSLAPKSKEAAQVLVEVARDLGQSGPRSDELAAVRAERRRIVEHPESGFGRLEQAALEELEIPHPQTQAELDAEIEAVTAADIATAFQQALPSAVIAIPNGVPMTLAGFTPIPLGSGDRINGFQVSAMPEAGHSDVIDYSDVGISLTQPNRTTIGMRWTDIAVAMWWTDGRRTLIATEGTGVTIFPAKWRYADPLLEKMRERVPKERWIAMDDPDALPRAAGPVCGICEASPAIEVTFQDPKSVVMFWLGKVHGIFCRDCGIATFRLVQKRVMVRGWWSIPGVVYTPVALAINAAEYLRFRGLPVPIRTSGIDPLAKGRSVLLSSQIIIPAGLALWILYIFWPR